MIVEPTTLPDVLHIKPDVFRDERGTFVEKYHKDHFLKAGVPDSYDQDNLSISKQGVLRGLHFQLGEHAQAKLVSVVQGSVFDVAVDIRQNSPTFGKWVGVTLTEEEQNMLYIPKGFAHGFYVLSPVAHFSYKCDGVYNKEASSGVRWNDPDIGISWPLNGTPILSKQDQTLPLLETLR